MRSRRKGIHQLAAEGQRISTQALAFLSPYQTRQVKRFGQYTLQLDRIPEPVVHDLPLSVVRPAEHAQ